MKTAVVLFLGMAALACASPMPDGSNTSGKKGDAAKRIDDEKDAAKALVKFLDEDEDLVLEQMSKDIAEYKRIIAELEAQEKSSGENIARDMNTIKKIELDKAAAEGIYNNLAAKKHDGNSSITKKDADDTSAAGEHPSDSSSGKHVGDSSSTEQHAGNSSDAKKDAGKTKNPEIEADYTTEHKNRENSFADLDNA